MTVIALSSFVVVPDYALAGRDECEAVLVGVSRTVDLRRDDPNNDFGEQFFVSGLTRGFNTTTAEISGTTTTPLRFFALNQVIILVAKSSK